MILFLRFHTNAQFCHKNMDFLGNAQKPISSFMYNACDRGARKDGKFSCRNNKINKII
jgi:hypothetical protein